MRTIGLAAITSGMVLCGFFASPVFGQENDARCEKYSGSKDCNDESSILANGCDKYKLDAEKANQAEMDRVQAIQDPNIKVGASKSANMYSNFSTNLKKAADECSYNRKQLTLACKCARQKAQERYDRAMQVVSSNLPDKVRGEYAKKALAEKKTLDEIDHNEKMAGGFVDNHVQRLSEEAAGHDGNAAASRATASASGGQ